MDIRYTKMLLHLYAPAIGFGLMAWVINIALARIAQIPILAGVAAPAKWLVLLSLAGTVCLALYASWRYWRWASGRELGCVRCSGLLSGERLGRRGRFRRCLACNGSAPVQN
jgi:hypothetical protein